MSERGIRPLVVLVCAVVFVDTVFYAAITPLLPRYREDLGLTTFEAGVLAAGYPAGTLIAALPCGWLAAKLGVRAAVVLGLAVMSVSSVVFGFAEASWLLVAARFVQGVAGAASWAGALGWLGEAAPAHRRGELIGVAFGAAVAGALCGPALGALADVTGPQAAFSGIGVIGAVLLAFALRLSPPHVAAVPLRRALAALGDQRMLAAMWLVTLPGIAFGTIGVLVPLRLDDLGAGALVIAAVFTGAGILETVVSPIAGRVSDRRGRLVPLRIAVAFAVVLVTLLPVPSTVAMLCLLVLFANPAVGLLYTPAMALLSDGAHDRDVPQGLAFSLSNATWGAGQTLGAAGSAALAEAAGRGTPFLVVGALMAVTLAGLLSARRLAPAR